MIHVNINISTACFTKKLSNQIASLMITPVTIVRRRGLKMATAGGRKKRPWKKPREETDPDQGRQSSSGIPEKRAVAIGTAPSSPVVEIDGSLLEGVRLWACSFFQLQYIPTRYSIWVLWHMWPDRVCQISQTQCTLC